MKYSVIFGVCVLTMLVLAIFTAVSVISRDSPQRKAVLYDYNGKILKEYSGKIEYVMRSGNGVRFQHNGRRVIIQGGIIVVEDE